MGTTRAALTQDDIRTLVRGATAEERASVAQRLCRTIDSAPLSDEERLVAGEILRIMAADAAEMVRRALAVSLQESPLLPRDVALQLARDVESVSLPVLNFSPVFTDQDLAEVVRLGGPARQLAIARRPVLSEVVTSALSEHAGERALTEACANPDAAFAEPALMRIAERFETSERVLAAVAFRNSLPLAVTERLMNLVSDQVREHLVRHHAVSAEIASQLAVGAVERATIDLVDEAGRAADVKGFVGHLHASGRLSASLMLRALAHGHMTFFEWSVSELARVPHHRTWLMIHDAGPLGLQAIYERAGLPARLFPAFRAAVDIYHSMEVEGSTRDTEDFQRRMLERFLTQPATVAREDLDFLLDRMDHLTSEAMAAA